MIKKEKVAIVRVQVRENAPVKFCALLPQDEQYDAVSGFQTPPGFQLIVLPYAEDIRDLDAIM
jgi:ATP-dependent DNA helicase 2 subunit 1